jgi:pimeloyl-ACP methyl ester carboxylesterase
VILLVHGLAVGAAYFRPLVAELGSAHAPEFREPLPIPELAERFAQECSRPALVVANSMGCQVAAELAVRRSELVRALVLVGPTVDPEARSLLRQAGRLVLDGWYEPVRLSAIVARDYVATGPLDVVRQARHALGHRIEDVLPRVEQPAVVVRGAADPVCPDSWARRAASLLPDGRLVTVARAAHAAHFSHPREVAALVDELQASSPP